MRKFFRILLVILNFHSEAQASLGEKPTDHGHYSHKTQKLAMSTFSIQIVNDEGREVREFIDQNEVVFAVSWKGRTHPDLSQILGSYFSEYQSSGLRAQKPQGRNPKLLKTPRMNIHFYGHMGSVKAYAYVERLLPAGFDVEALR